MKPIKAICRRCGLKLEILGKTVKVTETTEIVRIENMGTIDTSTPLAECPECAELYAAENQDRKEGGQNLVCACGGHKTSGETVCKACASTAGAQRLKEMTLRMHFDKVCPKCGKAWSDYPGKVCPDCEPRVRIVPVVNAMQDFRTPVSGGSCEVVD